MNNWYIIRHIDSSNKFPPTLQGSDISGLFVTYSRWKYVDDNTIIVNDNKIKLRNIDGFFMKTYGHNEMIKRLIHFSC
jgi:hypothetical protein